MKDMSDIVKMRPFQELKYSDAVFSGALMDEADPNKPFSVGNGLSVVESNFKRLYPRNIMRKITARGLGSLIGFGGVSACMVTSSMMFSSATDNLMIFGGVLVLFVGNATTMVTGLVVNSKSVSPKEVEANKTVKEMVKSKNLEVFDKWLFERHGLTVDYQYNRTVRDRIMDKVSYSWENSQASEPVHFTSTDGEEYVLTTESGGHLIVKQKEKFLGKSAAVRGSAEFKDLMAKKEQADSEQLVQLSQVEKMLRSVKVSARNLNGFSLTVEQNHVVERSVMEAEDAMALLNGMKALRSDVSDDDAMEVMQVSLRAIRSVADDVFSSLSEKATLSRIVASSREKDTASVLS